MSTILRQPLLLLLCVGVVLLLSTFVGYRLALITGINEDAHRHEHIASLRDGLFILLGLLLSDSRSPGYFPDSTKEQIWRLKKRSRFMQPGCEHSRR